jgi:hypothetical protein
VVSCALVVQRLSAYRDGELPAAEAGAVTRHLGACARCHARWASLVDALDLLASAPRLEPREPIAVGVFERLDMEARRPSLATLFRPLGTARPVLLPSLASAFAVLASIVATVVSLDRAPEPLPPVAEAALPTQWSAEVPLWGTDSYPLVPSRHVSAPRSRGAAITPAVLEHAGDGSLFLETVVRGDGTVSAVTLLGGDRERGQLVADALRHQRFEPGRFRGRPVAVSVYMLISHTEVREPIT